MNFIKKFFADKGVGYYLTAFALVFSVISLVLYGKNGITKFSATLNTSAIVCLWITIALLAVSLVFQFKQVKYVAYFACLFGLFGFVQSQATYIANVFVAIDGNSFSGGFIATTVFFVLAVLFSLLSAALTNWKPWSKKASEAENSGDADSDEKETA